MNRNLTIQASFEYFSQMAKMICKENATDDWLNAIRPHFYAGFAAALRICHEAADLSDDAADSVIEGLMTELENFQNEFEERKDTKNENISQRN